MLINFSIILLLLVMISYLLLLANGKFYWLSMHSKITSISLNKNHSTKKSNKVFFKWLGQIVYSLFPQATFKSIENDLSYLGQSIEKLYENLAYSVINLIISGFAFIITANSLYLASSLLITAFLLLEPHLLVKKAKAEIDQNIDHIAKALKILVIKTEVSVSKALEIISINLPAELKFTKIEIERILQRASKISMKEALYNWQSDLPNFRDFIALLISVEQGVNKRALADSFENFLAKINEDKKERQKAFAENLQLYLLGPIVIMLLIIMLPMLDAIQFMMNRSGVFN